MGRKLAMAALLIAIVAGLWWNQDRGLKAVATETHASLCAFKIDLEGRAKATDEYIADLAAGRRQPIRGVTTADLERSASNQKATLDALAGLRC